MSHCTSLSCICLSVRASSPARIIACCQSSGKGSLSRTCFGHVGISNVLCENSAISLQYCKDLGVHMSVVSTRTNAASKVDLSSGHDELVDLRMRNERGVKG